MGGVNSDKTCAVQPTHLMSLQPIPHLPRDERFSSPALGRSRPLAHRALPHTGRSQLLAAVLCLLGGSTLLAGCAGEAAGKAPLDPAQIAQRIERLIELCTPLDPTLTSDHHDRQLHAQRALVEELSRAGPELGRAALEAYERNSTPDTPDLLRVRLLEVASHAAPEHTRPKLVALLTQYGYPMLDRTESARLLAETSPTTALELLEPMVSETRRSSTMPDDEFLVRAYVTACRGAQVSPVPVLARFVTNIYKQEAARHYAAQALGEHPEPLGIKALEAVLIESTGNGYLRRKAAQALRVALPAESACTVFRAVADREADMGFLEFLISMIEANCP